MTPKISVLMNCYNGARYLREAIESVLVQTYPNWELIFWDNQSTDASREIAESYGPHHTILGEARRLASTYFSGEWIGFLDTDDVWFPFKLERQVAAIKDDRSGKLGLVYGVTEPLVESGIAPPHRFAFQRFVGAQQPEGEIFGELIKCNFIALPSMLVKYSAFTEVGGFSGRFPVSEDYFLSLRIAHDYHARAVQEPICRYRIHGDNASLDTNYGGVAEDLRVIGHFLPELPAVRALPRLSMRYLLHRYRDFRYRTWPKRLRARGG